MMDDAKALQLARDAYTGSTDYFNANIRRAIEDDLRQFQSRHAPDSKYNSDAYRTRSRLYRPKTRSVIRKNEAQAAEAFFSTVDVVNVEPQDEQDELQQASAEIQKALLQYRLTKTIPWFQIVLGAYQDAQAVGVVVSHQGWLWNEKRKLDTPTIDLLPIENFRFDPAASWLDPVGTSPYLIRLIPMYVHDVKQKMVAGRWQKLSDQQLLTATTKYDSTRLLREDNRTDSRDKITAITDFTTVWVHQVIMRVDDEDVIYYTLGEQYLLTSPEPLVEHYAHGRRPFVVGSCVIETHKPYPSGVSRLTRNTQVEINELANMRVDNVKFAMNKRYFVARNKQVDIRSLTRNVPGSVTLLNNPETDVKVIDTPDVTRSSYEEQDRLNGDFDDLAGAFSGSSVASNRRLNETVGGLQLLEAPANQMSAYQLKTFVETWVEPVLRQIALLEQCYETDARILALVGKQSPAFQRFGMNQVTDELLEQEMTLTVSVGMGATSPTQKINQLLLAIRSLKEALADGVLERYGMDPIEVVKEIFGALGYKDGGRFFKAMGSESDPRVASLMQQVQQLTAELEAKHPRQITDAQARLLNAQADQVTANKVKVGVEAAYGAMQAAEVIATIPAVAPVADKVMQTAGYQVPMPAGVDPNYPTGPQAMSEAGLTAIQTGADQQAADVVPDRQNTSPMQPSPGGPSGAMSGIETQRADGVQQEG